MSVAYRALDHEYPVSLTLLVPITTPVSEMDVYLLLSFVWTHPPVQEVLPLAVVSASQTRDRHLSDPLHGTHPSLMPVEGEKSSLRS